MCSLVTWSAQGHQVLRCVGRKQPRLSLEVCAHRRPARATSATRRAISLERGGASLVDAFFVVRIERHVQRHSGGQPQKPGASHCHGEDEQQSLRMVEDARGSMLRRVRLIEETHRGKGADAPLPQAEPRVVIGVDQHAPDPETDRARRRPRAEHRRADRSEGEVVPDAHGVLITTAQPPEGAPSRDTTPSCAPIRSEGRSPQ
jgi:hypothetical protein